MRHPFENYLVSRDEYFKNPEDIIELSKLPAYSRATFYPGQRTDNLMSSHDPEVKRFAEWFADRLSRDVFPGISMYEMFVCFHINDPCSDPLYNHGWIHNDHGNLAGLVYLTPEEDNIDTGTSIFTGEFVGTELPGDAEARANFHFKGEISPDFVKGFERNQNFFKDKETIRIGNKYNRLIAYDSKMWHRPNSYTTTVGQPRLSLLFFISRFNFIE